MVNLGAKRKNKVGGGNALRMLLSVKLNCNLGVSGGFSAGIRGHGQAEGRSDSPRWEDRWQEVHVHRRRAVECDGHDWHEVR